MLSGCRNSKEEIVTTVCKSNIDGLDTELNYNGKGGVLTKITNVSEMTADDFRSTYGQMYNGKTIEKIKKSMENSVKRLDYIQFTLTIDGNRIRIRQVNNIGGMFEEEFKESQFISLGNYGEIAYDKVIEVAKKGDFTCK